MDIFRSHQSASFHEQESWGQGVKGAPKDPLPTTPPHLQPPPPAVPRASITTAAQRFSGSRCHDNTKINWHAQTLCANSKSDIIP